MKPRNFPGRRLYRVLCLAWRRGETLTPAQLRFIGQPIDTRILSRPDAVPLIWQNGESAALVSVEGCDEFRGVVMARQWGAGNRRVAPVCPSSAGFTQ